MKATNIRKGNILKLDNELWKVLNMDHVTPGKGRAHVQTKMRKLSDGTQTERRFRSDEDVEKAFLENKEMQYLYGDGEGHHFMNTESYEQVALGADILGNVIKYLVPDSTLSMQLHDGFPVGIDLPPVVTLKVVETPPGVKDATASAQRKPATMETGLIVLVPPFINEGERIRVNTEDGSYSERAK
jgi:elongation factor P